MRENRYSPKNTHINTEKLHRNLVEEGKVKILIF